MDFERAAWPRRANANLAEIAAQVLAFLAADGVRLSADLTQVEGRVLAQVRWIGAQAVEQHLAGQKLGYAGAARPCPCGRGQRFVGYRRKAVATQLGTVRLRRAYYRCRHCGASAFPSDRQVGLGDSQVSVGLAQGATLLGLQRPFAPASETLYPLTGQRLSERTVERLTEPVGAVAAAQEAAQAAARADWRARQPRPGRSACPWRGTGRWCIRRTAGTKPSASRATGTSRTADGRRSTRWASRRRRRSWVLCGRGPVAAGWRRPRKSCGWATGHRGSGSTSAGSQHTLSLRVAWLNGDWHRLWAQHPRARAA